MRLISVVALCAALMSTLLMPVAAAPVPQAADVRAILDATAAAMDSAQSLGFSGAMDMRVSTGASPAVTHNMPMSGGYQAPDRMTMSVQMPDLATSMDVIMVGGEVWTRRGQGRWAPSSPEGVYASTVGKSHADWFRGFADPAVTDLGAAYRITSNMDVSNALNVGPSGVLGSGSMPFDLSAATARATLTIDKSTSYMVALQMDILLPLSNAPGNVTIIMNLSFSDFDDLAIEILPPV